MRRTFEQILKSAKVNYIDEYLGIIQLILTCLRTSSMSVIRRRMILLSIRLAMLVTIG